MRLPTRPGMPDLSSTRRAASRMLATMRRRFGLDRAFRAKYEAFLQEYQSLNHMTLVDDRPHGDNVDRCYLPHHGILKGQGDESKIRVVFNGSSRTPSGTSLNDALYVGPNLLPVLSDVVTRWRRHRFVFIADIEKMYRQISVHPEDRRLQCILWTDGEQIREYELNTVTYGLACAPFLAIRVLRQLADDEKDRHPLGAETLHNDVYMDDVLTGASTLEAASHLRAEVDELCTAGGFPLRKWAANHAALLRDVPSEHQIRLATDAWLPSADHSVLGLRWCPSTDDFALTVRGPLSGPPTKRAILSQTARLFDPLGWIAPIVIRAKLIIQATWIQHLEWDAPLATEEAAA